MRRTWTAVVALAAILAVAPLYALASPGAAEDGGTEAGQARFGGWFHALPLAVGAAPAGPEITQAVIDSAFVQVSVDCLECGGSCPPAQRTVVVVLEATAPVAAGYDACNLTSSNYTVDSIALSTNEALAVGDQLTITIVGDVIACGSSFNVWLSMCGELFDPGSVVDEIEDLIEEMVDILETVSPPGVNGLINKLIGNNGVLAQVLEAYDAYQAGLITTQEYIDALNDALAMLSAFDNQLQAKIDAGQIVEPEASDLQALSQEIRDLILLLIANA